MDVSRGLFGNISGRLGLLVGQFRAFWDPSRGLRSPSAVKRRVLQTCTVFIISKKMLGSRGILRSILGRVWGSSWGRSGCLGGHPQASEAHRQRTGDFFKHSTCHKFLQNFNLSGAFGKPLGASSGPMGAAWGRRGSVLGAPGPISGSSWTILAASRAVFGPSRGRFGTVLGGSGALVKRSWRRLGLLMQASRQFVRISW